MSIDQDDSLPPDLAFLVELRKIRASLEKLEKIFAERYVKMPSTVITEDMIEKAELEHN